MKFRPAYAAVISIGTSLLLLSGIRCAQAAEIKIVSPGAYEDIEGPDRSEGSFFGAFRAQGIAHRSEFDALPVGGAWLTEIRFRPDGTVPVGVVASFGRVQLTLSVTQVDPLDISFTFADNITGTPVEVYNAAWSSTVINPDPPGAETRPFDFRIPLETPYFYNPAEGNLLLDSIREMPGPDIVNGLAKTDIDLSNAFSGKRDIWSGSLGVDSPMSFAATFTAIVEYVFIPEPPALPGDYNRDGTVDAADYTVWRDALTAGSTTLPNDPTPGTVDESDFLYWRDHYGEALGSGAGSVAAIPEPSTLLLLCIGALGVVMFRRRHGNLLSAE